MVAVPGYGKGLLAKKEEGPKGSERKSTKVGGKGYVRPVQSKATSKGVGGGGMADERTEKLNRALRGTPDRIETTVSKAEPKASAHRGPTGSAKKSDNSSKTYYPKANSYGPRTDSRPATSGASTTVSKPEVKAPPKKTEAPKASKAPSPPPLPVTKPGRDTGASDAADKAEKSRQVRMIQARSGPGRAPTGPVETTKPPKAPSFVATDATGSRNGEQYRSARYSPMDRNK